MLGQLRDAGMNIGALDLTRSLHSPGRLLTDGHSLPTVRMNFSHGSYEYHQSVIDNTRQMIKGESTRGRLLSLTEKGLYQ